MAIKVGGYKGYEIFLSDGKEKDTVEEGTFFAIKTGGSRKVCEAHTLGDCKIKIDKLSSETPPINKGAGCLVVVNKGAGCLVVVITTRTWRT